MDDLQMRAMKNMPENIRRKLSADEDLLTQMEKLTEADMKQLSVTITKLVEHAALMADKPRQQARKDGDRIHAEIERKGTHPCEPNATAARPILCAVR